MATNQLLAATVVELAITTGTMPGLVAMQIGGCRLMQ